MVPATTENKTRLLRWVNQLRPSGGTHPQEALQIGINMQPSAIFLLSDGGFSSVRERGFFGGKEPEARDLVANNDPGHVPIHTVALEEPGARENLREISTMTSGQFIFVPYEGRGADCMVIANRLEAEGRVDLAQRYYLEILTKFPDTPVAGEALRRRREYLAAHSKDR